MIIIVVLIINTSNVYVAVRAMLRRIASDVVAKRVAASPTYDADEAVVSVSAMDRMDCGAEVCE